MKRAIRADKPLVVKILSESFKNDPYMNWITKKSKHPNKLGYILEYIVDETFENGEIYLSDDNMAAALWNTGKKEKPSLNYIYRNLLFLFRFGFSATFDIVEKDRFTHKQYPAADKYCHLYLIGVLPEGQGKGLAAALMNPMLEKCSRESIPVILETANPANLEIYTKKGFSLCNTVHSDNISIFYMKR